MYQSWSARFWTLGLASYFTIGVTITFSSSCAMAQTVVDRTLGVESSVVTPNTIIDGSSNERIDGGAIRGKNLFHSFEKFNVGEGQGVYFSNPAGIENILSRVTGDSSSNIFGKLGVLGNANLFLINPNGIVFGSKASLNLGGSFLATTANTVEFGNRGFFSASAPDVPPALTVNPSALLFNQIATRSISNSSAEPVGLDPSDPSGLSTLGGLRVPDGRSLLLVGGNVSLNGGGLNALSGRIELAGLSGEGRVGLDVNGSNLRLSFPERALFADISLANGSSVNTSGKGGGNIQLQGRRVTIANGSQILTTTIGAEPGGDLTVTASESVTLIGKTPNGFNSGLFSATVAAGNSGNIKIATGKLFVLDGAAISTQSSGVNFGEFVPATGRGGNLTVNASESVELTNGFVASGTLGSGDAGDLSISTKNLIIRDASEIAVSSQGTGSAGNLQVQANSIDVDDGGKLTATSASGEGGNIWLRELNLFLLRDNSEISTDATGGNGNGGNITINSDTLAIANSSNITARAIEGRGGNIRIATQALFVSPASNISAASQRGIDGVVEIRRPDVDPTAELVILPANVVDVSSLVAQGCAADGSNLAAGQSQFTIAGRGGLPPTPAEATRGDTPLADLGAPIQSQEKLSSTAIPNNPIPAYATPPLVEANGWVIGDKGEVVLMASSPETPDIPWLKPTSCHNS